MFNNELFPIKVKWYFETPAHTQYAQLVYLHAFTTRPRLISLRSLTPSASTTCINQSTSLHFSSFPLKTFRTRKSKHLKIITEQYFAVGRFSPPSSKFTL